MTKLAVSVLLGAWLMVALAIIAQAQSSTEAPKSWFKRSSKEPTPIEKRTDDDWNKLGKACAKKLSKRYQSIRESLSELKGISEEADCTDELQKDILYWLRARLPGKCDTLAHDYFDHYLLKCGFEESLNQVFDNIQQMSPKDSKPIERRSASSYVGEPYGNKELSIIKELAGMGQISDETSCTEQLKTKFENWLDSSLFLFKLRPLMSKYLALYLDKCGFEDQFGKVIKGFKQSPHIKWDSIRYPTLSSHLEHDYWQQEKLSLTLSAVEKLSEWESSPIEGLCTMDHMSEIQEMIIRCDPRYTLQALVKNYLARFLDKCGFERSFKKLVDSTSQNSGYSTRLLTKYETLFDAFEEWGWKSQDQERAVVAIRELSTLESISEANCTIELKDRLLHWLSVYGDEIWFPRLIRQYLFMYLDNCGVKELSKRLLGGDIENLIGFPRLFGYSYSRFSKNVDWILSAIQKVSELKSVSYDTGCSQELRTNLLEPLDFKQWNYGTLRPLLVKYYALYSDKCGLEESFKKRVANMNADGHWNLVEYPTLSSYVIEKFLGKPTLNSMLTLIGKLSGLDTTSTEIECSNELTQELLGATFGSKQDYPELHSLLKEYLTLYKGKCGWLDLDDIV